MFHMTDKNISSQKTAPGKGNPDDKSKAVPEIEKPATQPEKTPAEIAPAKKS
jgi:hypothetical protein